METVSRGEVTWEVCFKILENKGKSKEEERGRCSRHFRVLTATSGEWLWKPGCCAFSFASVCLKTSIARVLCHCPSRNYAHCRQTHNFIKDTVSFTYSSSPGIPLNDLFHFHDDSFSKSSNLALFSPLVSSTLHIRSLYASKTLWKLVSGMIFFTSYSESLFHS